MRNLLMKNLLLSQLLKILHLLTMMIQKMSLRMLNLLLKRQLLLPRLQAVLIHLTKILMRKVKRRSLHLKRLPRLLKRRAVNADVEMVDAEPQQPKTPATPATGGTKTLFAVRTCLKRLVKLLMLDLLRIRMMAVSEALAMLSFLLLKMHRRHALTEHFASCGEITRNCLHRH
ncbi:uncharacterized protein LOC108846637 [Raphanus sativus]|uniref:Uncharacterized protein LOC108846637 n=1 Tax=Raphanus sativus TaxID=3726 RepID=A0A9W3D9V9_RAPSA|nr:uncharacterized protein LOC108846637 [Raphanus sativus]